MSAIFISHSSRDNDFAKELEGRLKEQNHHSVFLDLDPEKGIVAGQSWERTLYRKLRACRAVVAVCTDHYLASHWCFAEIALARMERKPIFALTVDPLSEDAKLPSILTESQYINLRTNQEEGYKRLWRGFAEARLEAELADTWNPNDPPYPGLLAFRERDAPIFFGREIEIKKGLDLLNSGRRQDLVLVLGTSGSGKSSLVRAGIVPRLQRDQDHWLVVGPLRPGQEPLEELAASLGATFQRPLEEIVRDLETIDLAKLLRKYRRATHQREATVILVIDQFEELLGHAADNPANRFLALLRMGLEAEATPLLVLATLRSDFLSLFQQHADLGGIDFDKLSLGPMSIEGLRRIIEEPAKLGQIELEAGLIDRLLEDTGTPDAMPLLAFTLRMLWDNRHNGLLEIREYDALGGLQGAVAAEAKALFQGVIEGSEDDLRTAFLKMTRVTEEGRYASRPIAWDDIPTRIRPVIKRFVERRLLSVRKDGTVEVAHESLFRNCEKLVGWLDGNSKELLLQREIYREAALWKKGGERANEDLLWRGSRMQQAKELVDSGRFPFEDVERSFVAESHRVDSLSRERLLARHLAAHAELSRIQQANLLERSVLLAVESMRRLPSVEVEQTLRQGLALLPRCIASMPNEHNVVAVSVSPDEKHLATASGDTVSISVVRSGERVITMRHDEPVKALTYSPDGRYLAAASAATATIWEAATGRDISSIKADKPPDTVSFGPAVSFSPDGHCYLSIGNGNIATVWELFNREQIAQLTHNRYVGDIVFSSDGRYLATASDDTATVWEIANSKVVVEGKHYTHWPAPNGNIHAVAFSLDGRYFATASNDGTARVWDLKSTSKDTRTISHSGPVRAVVFSPDGGSIATASRVTVQIWELDSGKEMVSMPHDSPVVAVFFSLDGYYVVTVSSGIARVWDASNGQESVRMPHGGPISFISSSISDGPYLVTVNGDTVWVRPVISDEPVANMLHNGAVGAVSFHPDGRYIVTASEDRTARIWEWEAGGQGLELMHGLRELSAAEFSADGRYVATADSYDYNLSVYRVDRLGLDQSIARSDEDPVRDALLVRIRDPATDLAFSRDGRYLATAGGDRTARVWDLAGIAEVIADGDRSYSKEPHLTVTHDSSGTWPSP